MSLWPGPVRTEYIQVINKQMVGEGGGGGATLYTYDNVKNIINHLGYYVKLQTKNLTTLYNRTSCLTPRI